MKHRILRIVLALLLLALLVNAPAARQTATSADRVALYQALLDLQNPWTVMCVAAHPDDEDGTSLIVMRHKYGAHTVSLFSTFGEGGQNAIGPELYEEMGAIRARETMAAAEIQGSEPHFLGLKDFGFSKTRDEAFKFWGHEDALRRMVLEIRKLRPDVIITNHSTTSNDHGQHQATALMVVEAFDAAADPNKFADQLKDGVTTWQVQRLFVRQRGNPAADAQIVTIDPNERDPVRGVVYAEEALRALQQHATQGPWPKTFAEYANRFRAFSGQSAPTGQLPMIRYALVRSANGTPAMPGQESHNFLNGLRLLDTTGKEIALPDVSDSLAKLSSDRTAALAELSSTVLGRAEEDTINRLPDAHRQLMRDKFEHATALAAGLKFTTQAPAATVIPNSTANVAVRVENSGHDAIEGLDCGQSSSIAQQISDGGERRVNHANAAATRVGPGASVTVSDKFRISPEARPNLPLSQHLYEPTGLGMSLTVRCTYELSGKRMGIDLPARVDIAPPIEIAGISPSPFAMSPAMAKSGPVTFTLTVTNNQPTAFDGRLVVAADFSDNWPQGNPLRLAAGEKKTVSFTYAPPANANLTKANYLSFWVEGPKGQTLDTRWSREDVHIFSTGAITAPHLRVGYIRGFDFSLPNALNALGVESKELSVEDVTTADLSKYTSVIVDNRVYESKPQLIAVNQKLLDYAQAGGTLIVFYHKSDEWNPDPRRNRPQLAPYKLILGNERVTDENAPITFIEPDHPLLNSPNKMGQDDFRDWIQERGLYYPREWDPQFHALLQSNDPGENPLKGGLLVADYGKGHYIYTSMVWYRELRGGIPGAYRMLANMISYGRAN
jgi:LmbE family N-acetylglucosaminyl deacetylase